MTPETRRLSLPILFTFSSLSFGACSGDDPGNGTPLQPDDGLPVVTPTSPAPSTSAPVTPPPTNPTPPAVPPGAPPAPSSATPPPGMPPVTPPPVTPPPVTEPTATTPAPPANPPAPPVPAEPPPPNGSSGLGMGEHEGSGSANATSASDTENRYKKADVMRDGVNYFFMANGWGSGFENQNVSWNGTSFTVESMNGSPNQMHAPASYPTVFCGVYSDSKSKECGLPAPIADIETLRTGWRWKANGNTSDYNAAYDIWVANGTTRQEFTGFLMVWFRDPPGEQPAGQPDPSHQGITVENVPGTWDVWKGTVNNAPIINWVKPEGQDISELEFDVMDFVRDAPKRGFTVPGTHILSVAVGFELWQGPVTNLVSEDFYVDVVTK